jgi:drug/metabolite transporter (DMT)-like permease
MSSQSQPAVSWRGLVHLFVVYIVWSSTYLAIRVAVRPGGGFPPFALAAMRTLLAFPLLLLLAKARGLRIRPTRQELPILATSGILLWAFGNALVVVAEKRVDSALAAILIATTPIWVTLLECLADRCLPSKLATVALLTGFIGAGLIGYPALHSGVRADAIAVVVLLVAALSWGGGSLLQRRHPVGLDPIVSAAYQMLFGGLAVAILSFGFREPMPHPTATAWLGFSFLLVFGSLISFTSFLKALHLLPTRLVFTYGYVNPVIAAFLGWLLLGEHIAGVTVLGAGLVLLGVAGSFRAHR